MPLSLPQPPTSSDAEAAVGDPDNRYHVRFSDVSDGVTEVESLGLILTEGTSIGFNVQMTSPFSGQLGGQGNREDKDLSRWTVRSQSEWRGGRGQLTTYGDTDRFHDSLADTRFPRQVLLPPKVNQISLATGTDPQNVPTQTSTTGQMRVSSEYSNSGRTASNHEANATVELIPGSDPEYIADPIGVETSYTDSVAGAKYKYIGQSFTPSASITLSTVRLMLSKNGARDVDRTTISVRADNGESPNSGPSGTILWTHALTTPERAAITTTPTWYTFSDTPVALTSGVKYWILITHFFDGGISTSIGPAGYSGGAMWIQERLYVGAPDPVVSWPTDREILFRINNGSTGIDGALTRVRLAQSFVAASSKTTTSVRVNIARVTWAAGSVCSVNIYSDSGGSPNAIIGATGTITIPSDTNATWVTVSMACALVNATTYWLVITPNSSTFSNNITLSWTGSTSVVGTSKYSTETSGSWGSWTAFSQCQFHFGVTFSVQDDLAGYDTHDLVVTSRAQSFTTDASVAVTPSKVRLYLQLINWTGSPTLQLGIYANSGGLPTGAAIYSASLTQSTFSGQQAVLSANWVELAPGAPGALSLATKYWLVLTPTSPTVGDKVYVDWQMNTAGAYAGGESAYKTVTNGTGSWAAGTSGVDGYFIINNGTGSASAVTVRPVRFGSGWYIAAGVSIYKFNTSTSQLDLVYTAGATVTSLCAFAGKIYAALGDSTSMVESSTGASGSWSASAGPKTWTYLRAYNGYLYGAKSTGGSGYLAYTSDGTTWSSVTVANTAVTLSDIVGFQNEIIIASTTGLYSLSSSFVYQTADYSNEQYAGNGINCLTWMADGRMYVPIGQSLHAWDGVRLTPVGLDLDEGLPTDQQGHVSCLVGTRNFLFASVDGGLTARSGVYAYNGKGWHCLVQATAIGKRIRSMGLEQTTSSTNKPRLWFFEDGIPFYVEFPDLTDNPNGYLDSAGTGIAYQPTGFVTSSWMGGELSKVPKDFQSIIVASTGLSTNVNADIFVEVDRSGYWLAAGTVTQSPSQELDLFAGQWSPLTVSLYGGFDENTTTEIWVAENTATAVTAGDFIRVNDEIVQVASVSHGVQINLVTPLSAAAAIGDTVYPSRPAGKEVRYKIVLNTDTPTSTPVIHRVSVKMQELLIDKFRFTLNVRLEDNLRLRGSTADAFPYTAAELRAQLYRWIKRLTPFYLTDPGGLIWRVKVAYASESGFTRTNAESSGNWKSSMTIILDEV